jgi:hypothetical protein
LRFERLGPDYWFEIRKGVWRLCGEHTQLSFDGGASE